MLFFKFSIVTMISSCLPHKPYWGGGLGNIVNRGREMELDISHEYIDALGQVYTEYFFRYQDTPLVIINTSNIDFVNNKSDLKEILDFIRKPVSGTKFFNPAVGLK